VLICYHRKINILLICDIYLFPKKLKVQFFRDQSTALHIFTTHCEGKIFLNRARKFDKIIFRKRENGIILREKERPPYRLNFVLLHLTVYIVLHYLKHI